MTRPPPNERPTAQQLAAQCGGQQPMQIAGKPADSCPYCGCGMFKHGVNRTGREIVRYVTCRNKSCQKRFVTSQQPERIVREIGDEDTNSAGGNAALTLVRNSA